jgi:hypothetical protein
MHLSSEVDQTKVLLERICHPYIIMVVYPTLKEALAIKAFMSDKIKIHKE